MEKTIAAIGLLALAVLLIIFGPLFSIWSWNQLFGSIKTIDYTVLNWLAVVGLSMFFKNIGVSKK